MERKLQAIGHIPIQSWACSNCTWQMKRPTLGPYGWQTPKAIIAQVRMVFGKHNCAKH